MADVVSPFVSGVVVSTASDPVVSDGVDVSTTAEPVVSEGVLLSQATAADKSVTVAKSSAISLLKFFMSISPEISVNVYGCHYSS